MGSIYLGILKELTYKTGALVVEMRSCLHRDSGIPLNGRVFDKKSVSGLSPIEAAHTGFVYSLPSKHVLRIEVFLNR